GKTDACRSDYNANEDDNVLVQGVAGNKYALGFFGIGYYESNKTKVKAVAVDSGNGPVAPSIESVKNKQYTPLGRPLFIYVNSTSITRPEVQEFCRFYLSNSAALSQAVGFVPMTEEEIATEKSRLEAFITSVAGTSTAH
ncbi:MAG: protein sphX, partial [Flavobacteriales bacterium]|nr:protein sphX [Flavobacteriales bacterium]